MTVRVLACIWQNLDYKSEAIKDVVNEIDDVMHSEIVLDKLYIMHNFSSKTHQGL